MANQNVRPRIRNLKPEIWDSEDFLSLSDTGRLLFIGMISMADDEGRIKGSPDHLARKFLFGAGELAPKHAVHIALAEMEHRRMIQRYEVDGQYYTYLINWSTHQRVDRPSPSRHPSPPPVDESRVIASDAESSHTTRARTGPVRSGSVPDPSRRPDVNEEVSVPSEPHSNESESAEPVSLLSEDALAVWKEYLTVTDRTAKTLLNAKRRRLITQALKQYGLDDTLAAVRGWRKSPYHCGENATRTTYNDIELLLRDAKHIEQFRDFERGAATAAANGTMRRPSVSESLRQRAAEMRGVGA